MSKTCLNCGMNVEDNSIGFCPGCGKPMGVQGHKSGLMTAAYVFMILSCVAMGWMLIPLAWLIPMTVAVKRRMTDSKPLDTGFKICTLLFASTIAGILLLCDSEA